VTGGRRTTTLVLLPGMDGSGDLFAGFAAEWQRLEPAIPILVLRYPPDQALGYAELAAYVRARLPRGKDWVVLGESFSGPIAVMLAAAPGLLGLILCGTFLRNPAGGLRHLRSLLRWLPQPPRPLLRRYLMGEAAGTPVETALRTALASLKPGVLAARMAAVLDVDVRVDCARIRVPVLYLRAKRDRLIAPRVAEEIRRLLPQMRVADFDAPHLLLQTRPRETALETHRFVAGLVCAGTPA
jgi:pimeloyl-ACP methyl ester carboxylesterase